MKSYFLGLILFAAFLGNHSQAQGLNLEPVGKETPKPEGISLRMVSTNLTPDLKFPEWAVVGVAGEVIPLQLATWNISSPLLVQKSDRIRIYERKALETAVSEKKSMPRPVLEPPVASDITKCLIVLRPGKLSNSWECQVVDESVKQYRGGSRLFLNLTPYHLTGKAGDVAFDISPQGSTLVDPAIKSGDYRAVVQVFAQLPTRKATVLDEKWAFFPESRGIALIFESQGSIRLVGIPDEVPAEPKSPVASK